MCCVVTRLHLFSSNVDVVIVIIIHLGSLSFIVYCFVLLLHIYFIVIILCGMDSFSVMFCLTMYTHIYFTCIHKYIHIYMHTYVHKCIYSIFRLYIFNEFKRLTQAQKHLPLSVGYHLGSI